MEGERGGDGESRRGMERGAGVKRGGGWREEGDEERSRIQKAGYIFGLCPGRR